MLQLCTISYDISQCYIGIAIKGSDAFQNLKNAPSILFIFYISFQKKFKYFFYFFKNFIYFLYISLLKNFFPANQVPTIGIPARDKLLDLVLRGR